MGMLSLLCLARWLMENIPLPIGGALVGLGKRIPL
jgi:hypothetical protein